METMFPYISPYLEIYIYKVQNGAVNFSNLAS